MLLFLGINFLCGPFTGFSQGGDLLIQQYNRGPQLDSNYSKWSFRLGPQLNRINTDLGTTTPTLTLGGLVEIEYRFSKTVGLVSGAQFTPISYSYIEADTLAKDRLKYISYPLMLRLQPTYRLSFGLGIIYQAFLNGQKISVSKIKKSQDGVLVTGLPNDTDFSDDAMMIMIKSFQNWSAVPVPP